MRSTIMIPCVWSSFFLSFISLTIMDDANDENAHQDVDQDYVLEKVGLLTEVFSTNDGDLTCTKCTSDQ